MERVKEGGLIKTLGDRERTAPAYDDFLFPETVAASGRFTVFLSLKYSVKYIVIF